MATSRMTPFLIAAALAAGFGYYGYKTYAGDGLPDGVAAGNGRIEAVEIDVAAKSAGRVASLEVKEGDFVHLDQILARIDTQQLEAQKRQAEADLRRAVIGVDTAKSQVQQRLAEKRAYEATVAQRQAQLDAAAKRLVRSEKLTQTNTVALQVLDDDRATAAGARAALAAAEASVAAADAAIGAARALVVDAEAAVDAGRAAIDSVDTQIRDGVLKAPRDGRVQYVVAEPGEVVASGGRVVNMVDLTDVYMTFFLPSELAGKLALGAEARLVLDAAPQYVIPATVSFVSDVAQFTPKTVETEEERQKLMFRVRAHISPDLLRKYISYVKTGLPGVAYVRLDRTVAWPADLDKGLVK
ncbi:HlyD family secretion protein [Rhizobium sp. TRM95796]|uniref:HlyD family secretion protein n=1 Tax=Rhizobium sp. TRM95796 TaxID=2979862 RepID=UPI0021E8EB81|nr:HlyD family efflux transporter periplasmic adaptor subunit [Rhizobium sp. TRM95796]MCV3766194.1 HlyD family efflux transporter periplasmic adaptor subunit [Rhizobium sp. TRM95796]